MPLVCLFPLLAALNGMPQRPRDRNGRLERVMERASVVALALGLGHDAIAIPIYDEGVLVLVSVAHGLSC